VWRRAPETTGRSSLFEVGHTIEDVFATDDRVAVRFVLKGRHSGSFFGIPASGKEVTIVANVLMHVTGGKVSTLFGIFDEAGLLRQIGVLPG
jgi:predicted ester cyclase